MAYIPDDLARELDELAARGWQAVPTPATPAPIPPGTETGTTSVIGGRTPTPNTDTSARTWSQEQWTAALEKLGIRL